MISLIQQEVQPGPMAGSRDELSWQTSGWWPGGAAGWTRGHLYSCTAATAVTDRCSSQQHCLLAGQWSASWEPSSVRPQLSLSARPRPLARVQQCPPPFSSGRLARLSHGVTREVVKKNQLSSSRAESGEIDGGKTSDAAGPAGPGLHCKHRHPSASSHCQRLGGRKETQLVWKVQEICVGVM